MEDTIVSLLNPTNSIILTFEMYEAKGSKEEDHCLQRERKQPEIINYYSKACQWLKMSKNSMAHL
jgi:hypothetical protein